MLIIGHRGNGKGPGENTVAAVKRAWEHGADGVETDIRLTADHRIVAIHDPHTSRVTGRRLVVAESTLAELKSLEMRESQTIPTLDEILQTIPRDKRLFVELKSGTALVSPLVRLLSNSPLPPAHVALIGFVDTPDRRAAMTRIKQQLPAHQVWLLFGAPPKGSTRTRNAQKDFEEMTSIVEKAGADGVDVARERLNTALVALLKSRGLSVHAWDVDTAAQAERLRVMGVNSVTTDNVQALRCGRSG